MNELSEAEASSGGFPGSRLSKHNEACDTSGSGHPRLSHWLLTGGQLLSYPTTKQQSSWDCNAKSHFNFSSPPSRDDPRIYRESTAEKRWRARNEPIGHWWCSTKTHTHPQAFFPNGNGGHRHAHGPAQEGRRRLPVPPRRVRPGQDRPVPRRPRRAGRCRGHTPGRRRRGPPRPRGRALLPQHRGAGDHVPGGDPGARRGRAAQPGVHAGGVRVLPLRLRGAHPHHQRRRQRRRHRHRRRRQARARPHRRQPQGRGRPRPPRRPPKTGGGGGGFFSGPAWQQQRAVGRGPVPAHLRHHEPAQGGAAHAGQPGGVRPEHPLRVPPRGDGRHRGGAPAVPRARPPLRAAGVPGVRRLRHAARRGAVLGVHLLGRHARVGRHVVHGRAHHPPDHPGPPRRQARRGIPGAALHPQLQRVPGAGDPGEAGGGVRRAGAGGVRHDGGVAPHDVQPAAAGRPPEAGVGGPARGAGDGHPGRGGRPRGGREARGGVHPRRQRHARVQEQPGGQRGGLQVRVVPHGRHRRGGRPRIPAPGGPHQGAHQPRRREDLAHRGGRRAVGSPGGQAGGLVWRARRKVRRGDQLRCDPSRGCGPGRGGGAGALPEEPGGVQGAQEGVHHRRPAQDGHGKDPAAHRGAALCAAGQGLGLS